MEYIRVDPAKDIVLDQKSSYRKGWYGGLDVRVPPPDIFKKHRTILRCPDEIMNANTISPGSGSASSGPKFSPLVGEDIQDSLKETSRSPEDRADYLGNYPPLPPRSPTLTRLTPPHAGRITASIQMTPPPTPISPESPITSPSQPTTSTLKIVNSFFSPTRPAVQIPETVSSPPQREKRQGEQNHDEKHIIINSLKCQVLTLKHQIEDLRFSEALIAGEQKLLIEKLQYSAEHVGVKEDEMNYLKENFISLLEEQIVKIETMQSGVRNCFEGMDSCGTKLDHVCIEDNNLCEGDKVESTEHSSQDKIFALRATLEKKTRCLMTELDELMVTMSTDEALVCCLHKEEREGSEVDAGGCDEERDVQEEDRSEDVNLPLDGEEGAISLTKNINCSEGSPESLTDGTPIDIPHDGHSSFDLCEHMQSMKVSSKECGDNDNGKIEDNEDTVVVSPSQNEIGASSMQVFTFHNGKEIEVEEDECLVSDTNAKSDEVDFQENQVDAGRDEFELAGEAFEFIECPRFLHPPFSPIVARERNDSDETVKQDNILQNQEEVDGSPQKSTNVSEELAEEYSIRHFDPIVAHEKRNDPDETVHQANILQNQEEVDGSPQKSSNVSEGFTEATDMFLSPSVSLDDKSRDVHSTNTIDDTSPTCASPSVASYSSTSRKSTEEILAEKERRIVLLRNQLDAAKSKIEDISSVLKIYERDESQPLIPTNLPHTISIVKDREKPSSWLKRKAKAFKRRRKGKKRKGKTRYSIVKQRV